MLGEMALNGLIQHFSHSLKTRKKQSLYTQKNFKEISGISIEKHHWWKFQIEDVLENYWTGLLQYVFKKLLYPTYCLLLYNSIKKLIYNINYLPNILIEWKNCVTIRWIENISFEHLYYQKTYYEQVFWYLKSLKESLKII